MKYGRIYHSVDELPAIFGVTTLKEFFQISRSAAYKLVHRADFPTIRINRKIFIEKEQFRRWLNSQPNKKAS